MCALLAEKWRFIDTRLAFTEKAQTGVQKRVHDPRQSSVRTTARGPAYDRFFAMVNPGNAVADDLGLDLLETALK